MDWLTGKKDDSKKWITQLSDPAKRAQAANELLRLGPAAVDGLVEALTGKDSDLRVKSAQLLVKMGATAIPRLAQALASAHPETRQRVADILGETRHPSAVPPLIEATRGQYFTVRARAAAALAEIGDAQAVPALIALLADPESEVRAAAALAVGKFRDPRSVVRLSDLLIEDPKIEVRCAAAQGLAETRLPQAVPYFIEALTDSFWWYQRENAAQPILDVLEQFGAEAVETLIDALKNPESTVRRSAAILLGRIRDRRALEPLGMALYDLHYEVGEAAAESLARFGAEAVETLVQALEHAEGGIRLHAIAALGKIQDARVAPVLLELLHDPDREVRKHAIVALGQLRDVRALPALQELAALRADREIASLAREAMQKHSA